MAAFGAAALRDPAVRDPVVRDAAFRGVSFREEVCAVARLEMAEVLRSRWLLFCLGVYGVLAAVFVLVGMRESSVLGFTGMGKVLLALSHALVLLLPLLGLVATGQVINRVREDGSLELLFGHPIGRRSYFVAVSLVRYAVLVLPLVLLMLAMGLYGRFVLGHAVPWAFLFRALLVSSALLAFAVAVGLMISTYVRNPSKALMLALLVWAACIALMDFAMIGLMLQWRLQPLAVFAIAVLNPVQDARLALLSTAEPELSTLGPVGFYLANRVGTGFLAVLGIAWPALLGLCCWALTLRRFRTGDLL
jgi:ABC-type transport system involved in multi-copper enzyme maturation permease subunit